MGNGKWRDERNDKMRNDFKNLRKVDKSMHVLISVVTLQCPGNSYLHDGTACNQSNAVSIKFIVNIM